MTARVLLSLDDGQFGQLNSLAKKEHSSRTEIIRKAISEFLNRKKDKMVAKHELLEFAGAWKGKVVDGLEFQHKIRNEWDE